MRTLLAIASALLMLRSAVAQDDPGKAPPWKPGQPALPSGPGTSQQVKVASFCDAQQVAPGETFHLAFVFTIEPKWHIYWKNSGASGGPTQIQVTGPAGFTIGETLYPRPSAIHGEEGVSYGYEGKTVLYVPVTAPQELRMGQAVFTAKINWMVCKEVCLLGRTTQMVSVTTVSGDSPDTPFPDMTPIDPDVKEFKNRLPKPLSDLEGATATFKNGTLTISVPAQGPTTAEFFPVEVPGVTYDEPAVTKDADRLIVKVPVRVEPNNAQGGSMSIIGTLGLGNRPTDPSYDIEIPLPAP